MTVLIRLLTIFAFCATLYTQTQWGKYSTLSVTPSFQSMLAFPGGKTISRMLTHSFAIIHIMLRLLLNLSRGKQCCSGYSSAEISNGRRTVASPSTVTCFASSRTLPQDIASLTCAPDKLPSYSTAVVMYTA